MHTSRHQVIVAGLSSVRVDETGTLLISGRLDFQTVPSLWQQCLLLMSGLPSLQINFSRVGSASTSAALALLVEWIKYAQKTRKSLKFIALPEQLGLLLKATGLQEVVQKYIDEKKER